MHMSQLRAAVYGEFNYRRDATGLSSDQSFALFLTRLAGFVDRLVIVGRLDPKPGSTHHRLQGCFEFVPLPDYASLASFGKVLRATVASTPRLWRSLDGVDAVWLLGPNPLSIVFALLAGLRRRRVVLGVRQDIVALTRRRYGHGTHHLAAVILEQTWRLLARRFTVVTVGTALGRQYAFAKRVVPISVSLVEESDLVGAEGAEARNYGGALKVLSVGRLEPQKNPLLLADVLAELRRRGDRWRLVICGDGSMREPLAARLRELELSEHADLLGYVPLEGTLSRLYRECHAFLHLSWTEGFPQVLLEAFAAGLPTVATAVGGVEDWAAGGALLIPPGDAGAAAEALERLAGDPELRSRLVRSEIELARSHTVGAQCARVAAALRGDSPMPRD
jgi:glycosyltransferase involved in cell wall biosynthesis